MAETYKTVTIVGASGSLGKPVLARLLESKNLKVRALTRASSKATYPSGVETVEVDFSSVESLTKALQGQDVLLSTLASTALGDQIKIIDAAIAAGVKRIIPSEFGSDVSVPQVAKLPVFAAKVQVREYLEKKASEGKISYTLFINGPFLDWGVANNFLIDAAHSSLTLYDDGDAEFSSTTLASIADGVVGVIEHPAETRNRDVFVQDTVLTQNKLLELVQKVDPSRKWTVNRVKLDDFTAKADQRVAKGEFDYEVIVAYLSRSIYDRASKPKYAKLDNDLLGVKAKSDEEVFEIVKASLPK
jgi:uncharacterized protein YbjT (DUF2867 family)